LVKEYVNASLNDNTGKFRLKKSELAQLGLTHEELVQRVQTKFGPVKGYFGSGIGVELQFLDSEIAMGVLLGLARDNIPCLPIHDSFIVQIQHEYRLLRLMQKEFERLIGITSPVHVDREPCLPMRWGIALLPPPGQTLQSHLEGLAAHFEMFSIAQTMVAYWYEWRRGEGNDDCRMDFGLEDIKAAKKYLDKDVLGPSVEYQKRLRELAST